MAAVEVNDVKGQILTKIKADETVGVALRRLKPFGQGALEDNTGVALLDGELITTEGEPYVFKPSTVTTTSEFPVVEVFKTSDGTSVVVKWGEGDEMTGLLLKGYADFFSAENAAGNNPNVKVFSSLLGCDGGILTIGQTRYRIQVQQQLDDAIDTETVLIADCPELPQRSRQQAERIENYTATLDAYKQSKIPAYGSSRTKAKRVKTGLNEEETVESVVSLVFQRQATDALGTTGKQLAHFIPHNTGHSIFYEKPVMGALGQEIDENSNLVRMSGVAKQSLIHGSRFQSWLARTPSVPCEGVCARGKRNTTKGVTTMSICCGRRLTLG